MRFLLGAALSLGAIGAFAQNEAAGGQDLPPVVKRALSVQDKLKFSGKRLVLVRSDGETRTYEDLIVSDGRRYRVEYPQGSPRHGEVVIEQKGERYHYFPNENEVEVGKVYGDALTPRIGGVRGPNVELIAGGTEQIAGHLCQIVTVQRRFAKGAMQLWLDTEVGMVLKRQLLDASGKIVSGFEFREINYLAQVNGNLFEANFGSARQVTAEDRTARMASHFGFEPIHLSPSLGLESTGGRMIGSSGRPIFSQTYRADKGRLTIFRTMGKINPNRLRQLAKGLRSLSWERNGQTFVLVGDIDEAKFTEVARQLGAP